MNTIKITAALLLFSLVGAAAAEEVYPPETPFVSHKTRAQVVAELKQARANGDMLVNDLYPAEVNTHSTLPRQAVIDEVKQAQHSPVVSGGA
jgi:hypothetical protein